MQFHVYEITEDRYLRHVEADSISPKWLTDDNHRWIDLTEFQKHDLEALLAPLDLNSEILDACSKADEISSNPSFIFLGVSKTRAGLMPCVV